MKRLERDAALTGKGVAVLLALALAACAGKPDFGREQPGLAARLSAALASSPERAIAPMLPLTGPEFALRRIAANLQGPRPAAPGGDPLGLGEWADTRLAGTAPPDLHYYERLRRRHEASPVSLVNALADDIEADTVLMEQFSAACEEVIEADASRAAGLLGHPATAAAPGMRGQGSFISVRTRMDENSRLIDEAVILAAGRLVAYRAALAQARLDAPVPGRLAAAEAAVSQMAYRLMLMNRGAARHGAVMEPLGAGVSG